MNVPPKIGMTEPPERIPRLLSFLGLHAALGAAVGVMISSLLIMSNIAGLHDLITSTKGPFVALLLLYAFNALTFGSASMGIGVMTLPFDGECDRRDKQEPPGFHGTE